MPAETVELWRTCPEEKDDSGPEAKAATTVDECAPKFDPTQPLQELPAGADNCVVEDMKRVCDIKKPKAALADGAKPPAYKPPGSSNICGDKPCESVKPQAYAQPSEIPAGFVQSESCSADGDGRERRAASTFASSAKARRSTTECMVSQISGRPHDSPAALLMFNVHEPNSEIVTQTFSAGTSYGGSNIHEKVALAGQSEVIALPLSGTANVEGGIAVYFQVELINTEGVVT